MQTKLDNELIDADIFPYGTDELRTFEDRLTRYFSREYQLHENNDISDVRVSTGPIALAPKELAENHYDEGIDFFRSFLDRETMSYTMAFFDDDPEKAASSEKTLYQAQLNKFRLIASRMELKGDEKILNLGCGFGYFESYLLDTYPEIQVTSTTHSRDQFNFVSGRTRSAHDTLSSNRFKLIYTELDTSTAPSLGRNAFDLVCSMGLLEQINNITLLFRIIHDLLRDNGRMFHHLIVSRDLIPQLQDPGKTMIGDYFPGGKILPFKTLEADFDNFELENSWFINGINYWKTLDKWHANFWQNLNQIYPDILDKERVRYWNSYFSICKAMFLPDNGSAYGNGQYLHRKI